MKHMTLLSFNVRYGTADDGPNRWEVRRPRALTIVKRNRPDILCVQEALDFQVDEFALALKFEIVGIGRDDGKRKGEFSAILYDPVRFKAQESGTFWLSDMPEDPGSMTWGNRVTRICTWAIFEDRASKKRFQVYNTHLDHESQPSREKGVALILKRIRPGIPTLVTGDFNAGESNPAAQAMRSAGYRDTWRALHPDDPEPGTFSAFKELGTSKIDYLWADHHWSVGAARIVVDKVDGGWPSDHVPVMATVRLSE